MTGIIIIFILLFGWAVFLYFNRKSRLPAVTPEEANRARMEQQKKAIFAIEYPQIQRIINESLEIIKRTKNVDTGIGRFGVLKQQITRLLEIAPPTSNLTISVENCHITTANDIQLIDNARIKWTRSFFEEKINAELKKAEMLSTPKLQAAQLKKALNLALKSIDYLPEDKLIASQISDIESKIAVTLKGL